jgi:CO dehydrogenase/acetyl-CoA synthase beta subunit
MSTVIEFLEKMGADAHLRQATSDDIAVALAEAKVEASASEAILARNVEELYALLKQAPMFCVQTVPHKEDEEEEEEEEGDEEQETSGRHVAPSHAIAAHAVELA